MKNKMIAVLLCFLLIMLNVVGCSNSAGEQTSGTSEQKSDSGKVETITYAIWDKNQEPGMRAIADKFEEMNPNIKVKVEVTPWNEYWTKLEAAGAGGVLPDVFWMHAAQFKKYVTHNMLMPVGDKVKADPELDYGNYPEGLVKMYEYDGVNYAIPKDFDTIGLWYNKTMFDEAGIPYPDDTWDWDKLVEVAKKLTDESKEIWGFAAWFSDQEGYYNFIYQNGGEVISGDKKKSGFDMPETIEAIQFYKDLIYKHKVSPTQQQMAETSALSMFESGKIAMMCLGSWMVTEMKNNDYTKEHMDVAVLPQGKQRASIYNGLGNTIAANTKHPEAAWKFLKFLGTQEANLIQANHGSAIPAFDGTQQPWFEYDKRFNLKVYVDMLDYGVIYPNSKTRPKWGEIQNDILRKVFVDEMPVEEGCKKLAEEMNKLLATE